MRNLSKAAETSPMPRLEEDAVRRESNPPSEREFYCLNGESSDLTKGKTRVKMTLSLRLEPRHRSGLVVMSSL